MCNQRAGKDDLFDVIELFAYCPGLYIVTKLPLTLRNLILSCVN